ncbi:MAG: bifunctional folylpolyglutamate synthase/dihydrofolate synthase [Eubacteriales bacterium]
MTYEEALGYIHSVCWKGSRPGLERIRELEDKMGNPEDSLKFIHVAGTNGKGSVCKMLTAILSAAGYTVGMFTSPFVENFNERIMLGEREISGDELAFETEHVKKYAETMADLPTEFELITAIALSYYKRKKCDFVVLECGLGGRLDSTNVIKTPILSVITGIDLDHTALLGNTTAEIAAEKAGIIKRGVPVLFGEGDIEAENAVKVKAAEMGSPYYRTDFGRIRDVETNLDGTDFYFGEKKVRINLRGLYQTRNASTVLTAVEILRKSGVAIPEEAVDMGLSSAFWKARFEILSRFPLVIYDGAHNPQGISGAVENIRQYLSPLVRDGRVALLMGVMADKNHPQMIKMLAPVCEKAFTVKPDNARSLDSADVMREFEENGVDAESFDSLTDGVRAAVGFAEREKRPLVCLGSLYMYADVKKAVNMILEQEKE